MSELSAEIAYPNADSFDIMRRAATEPSVETALSEARAFNEMLADSNLTDTEVATLVNHVDSVWKFHGCEMRVTGDVTIYENAKSRQNGNIIDVTSPDADIYHRIENDEPMESRGFVAEYGSDGRYRVKLLAFCQRPLVGNGEIGMGMHYIGVDIDKAHVKFPEDISFEHAKIWLEVYAPDIINSIDELIGQNDIKNAADAIMALRDLDVSIIEEHADPGELKICLQAYLSSVLSIDVEVPYVIGIDGIVIQTDEQGNLEVANASEPYALITAEQVVPVRTHDTSTGEAGSRLFLRGIIHNPEQGESQVYVSLEALTRCLSVRDSVYLQA